MRQISFRLFPIQLKERDRLRGPFPFYRALSPQAPIQRMEGSRRHQLSCRLA